MKKIILLLLALLITSCGSRHSNCLDRSLDEKEATIAKPKMPFLKHSDKY